MEISWLSRLAWLSFHSKIHKLFAKNLSHFDDPGRVSSKWQILFRLSPFSSSLPLNFLSCLLDVFLPACVREQVTELSVSQSVRQQLPPFRPHLDDSYLCILCILPDQVSSVCELWCVDTFCSINTLHSGSQLAPTYFNVRHVSNLLHKIFFNLAGLPCLQTRPPLRLH